MTRNFIKRILEYCNRQSVKKIIFWFTVCKKQNVSHVAGFNYLSIYSFNESNNTYDLLQYARYIHVSGFEKYNQTKQTNVCLVCLVIFTRQSGLSGLSGLSGYILSG